MQTKQELRKFFREQRAMLLDDQLEKLSCGILENFKSFFSAGPLYRHVHVFISMPKQRELDTSPIIQFLWEQQCTLYTSQMNYKDDCMDTVHLEANAEVLVDHNGIPYPKNSGIISPEKIQLVLVPLLAVDKKGNRLGYGKGYYDKFFAQVAGLKMYKIGISLFSPIESIPAELHDVPLDACIHPDGLTLFT
jgi:5-formyltetrahydrofolate cyclo-ligase